MNPTSLMIVVDENIPYAEAMFSSLGSVLTVPGRQVSAEMVRNADLLMVRSVTRVGQDLLSGSKVRFVGTATAGTDHVDQVWLSSVDIGFSAAPGCNAESVAQYVAGALAYASCRLGRPLSECSIGIVGVGNCGSRVERIARALGMQVILCDPPLGRLTGHAKYRPLEDLLDCDFLTLHTPLTNEGVDATRHLIDSRILGRMRPDAVLINASRGEVVDEAALIAALRGGQLAGAIVDAWYHEPRINLELLKLVMIGTPHIAGYSFDGKVTGTRMIYESACQYLELPTRKVDLPLPPASVGRIEIDTNSRSFDSVASELLLTAYPIVRDAGDLRRSAAPEPEKMGQGFDRRRKLYPMRREFCATQVALKDAPPDWLDRLQTIGFQVIR